MDTPIIIENLDDLKKRIYKAGFGDTLDAQIEEGFKNGLSKLEIKTSETAEQSKMEYIVEINTDKNKAYFNGFRATIHQEGKDPLSHWFRAEDKITKDDAYIMMMDRDDPRAVHKTLYDKENKPYGVWLQINFKQETPGGNNEVHRYHDKFGYNLLDKLNDYAFAGLETAKQKLAAYNIIQKGLELELTPLNNGQYQKVIIKANPARKSITIMDTEGKYLSHDQFRTPEALERIQQQRASNTTRVDFTKPATEPAAEEVKKNSNNEQSPTLNRRNQPRIIANDNKDKKSLRR